MSCGRALEIDVARFSRERGAPRWEEFEAHVEMCEDCRREVELVVELGDAFSAGDHAAEEHLATESLARFSEEPGALRREVRRDIILHLAACRSCRDELTVLQRLDSVLGPARAASGSAAPPGLLARMQRVLRQPTFAYGVALLALLALVVERGPGREPAPPSPPVSRSKGFDSSLAPGSSESLELELAQRTRPVVRLDASTGLLLRIPTPLATAAVTVRAEVGGLEIRRTIEARDGFVELDVPGTWLRAGRYEVDVVPAEQESAVPVAFGFYIED